MKERFHKPKQVNHQRGFSMTESLVAADAAGYDQSVGQLFCKSSHQFQQASLRDSVNALIEQDLETIRSQGGAMARQSRPRQRANFLYAARSSLHKPELGLCPAER